MNTLSERLSTRKLRGPEPEPVTLNSRRIYILPTRHGVMFGVVLLVMLLGSLNYNNSLGFALTFLLGSMAMVSMLHTHRNLNRLTLYGARAEPVFAGQTACFPVCLYADRKPVRYAVRVAGPQAPLMTEPADVGWGRGDAVCVPLRVASRQRGRLRPGRFKVYTEFPLGLFQAWSWVELEHTCIVYPAPAPAHTPPAQDSAESGQRRADHSRGDDDFQGLRRYQFGDSPRHIAWKRLPASQELLTKQFTGNAGQTVWLDWHALDGVSVEDRLALLCRWVLDSHHAGHRYGLRMPDRTIEPDNDELHKHRCLKALALFEIGLSRQQHTSAP